MITYDNCRDRVGDEFTADTPAGPVPMRLTECVAIGPNEDTNSFSLTFTSASDAPIGQDVYPLRSDGLEPEPVFLVPIGPTADGAQYQAVFNRVPN